MFENSFVHPEASIGKNVKIGPFCYIDADVEIGDACVIEPHVTIYSGSRLGRNCHVFPGTVIGGPPQDLSYKGEKTTVEIGDNVTIREFCTLHRGSTKNWKTVIEKDCFLMSYAHVAHDCIVGQGSILANAVNLGGHVEVGEFSNIGGMVPVHQFCKIGSYSMIGGGVVIRQDVPPFVKVGREPAAYVGVNSIGLKRKGFSVEEVNHINDIYRIIFVRHRNIKHAKSAIMKDINDSPFRQQILDFVENSDRGLIKGLH